MTRYKGGWIRMLQQDRLQTEMKTLINYSVSLVEFIPEALLQLLGKELPLREWSKFLKSQEVKLFIKMQVTSSQDPSKEHLSTLWALGYLWIVCTNIPSSYLMHWKGKFRWQLFWIFWEISKHRQTSLERATSPFSGFLVQVSGWLSSSSATDGCDFLSQL